MATLALRLVFPAISLEGMSFWALRTAPLKNHMLFVQKFLFYSIIHVVIACILFGSSAYFFKLDAILVIYMLIGLVIANPVIVAVNLGIGAWLPNFRERNPSRISSSLPGVIAVTISFMFLIFIVMVFRIPVLHYYHNIFLGLNHPVVTEMIRALILILFGGIIIGGLPLWLGYRTYLKSDV
jgi:ABC-2 type transport system permease protein